MAGRSDPDNRYHWILESVKAEQASGGPVEPKRKTADNLLSIQQELIAKEPIFHRPEHGIARADFEAMTAPEFWEAGASGQRYSREYVLDLLQQRYADGPYKDDWKTEDFYCQEIAPDNYLLTYTLHQNKRVTRRATIWRRTRNGWVIVYHQGTIVEEK